MPPDFSRFQRWVLQFHTKCFDFRVKYETFDILTDEEVRQELKIYSDWPTYPQVYVNGELIGGLDIIRSMVEDKSLVPTLRGE